MHALLSVQARPGGAGVLPLHKIAPTFLATLFHSLSEGPIRARKYMVLSCVLVRGARQANGRLMHLVSAIAHNSAHAFGVVAIALGKLYAKSPRQVRENCATIGRHRARLLRPHPTDWVTAGPTVNPNIFRIHTFFFQGTHKCRTESSKYETPKIRSAFHSHPQALCQRSEIALFGRIALINSQL